MHLGTRSRRISVDQPAKNRGVKSSFLTGPAVSVKNEDLTPCLSQNHMCQQSGSLRLEKSEIITLKKMIQFLLVTTVITRIVTPSIALT